MESFIGQICTFGFNFAPKSWASCAGSLIAISQNQAMFALLGTSYGGDGRTNFGLPDLRGKVAVSEGTAVGSSYDWKMGASQGLEMLQLTQAQLPSHTHVSSFTPGGQDTNAQVSVSTDVATQDVPTEGAYLATNDGGRNPGVFIYRAGAGTGTVKLGGVSGGSGEGGTVTVQSTGGGEKIQLFQPTLTVNYCIAMQGLFPSRS